MEARLATGLWVSAWLHRLDLEGRAGYVLRRGDATAGAVLVKAATLDGRAALWSRQWDFETDTRPWTRIAEGPEAEIDATARRQTATDPDLWLLEVEARDGDPQLME
ncbi:DUF1491 family protein [Paracoccus sp. S-4012]|uniref:DUF1491 family protein n=1 Tax=Paracoccus sp. S-4012 TaxID=2665648 RepID=UPI0013283818|nr:DUF1491 family protein [Paracoccus sp. S-4012]